jgi:hypothetical protein
MKEWRAKNRDKVRDYQREYHREHQDELYTRRQDKMIKYACWRRVAEKYRKILAE